MQRGPKDASWYCDYIQLAKKQRHDVIELNIIQIGIIMGQAPMWHGPLFIAEPSWWATLDPQPIRMLEF